ncbi:dihydroneopterin aldolase [Chryseobacterium limigenitum]|uniref:7,8-dihydroneopterin aldolase n=1 Tax=Chryseobacterium limigenitum TaxID=1612149 RepID=A0A1K2IVN4_9FLAO|nr:dihydroneopterin aldolase [Chryseobacterium limigenitum]SFZ96497.1 dihydroneopterin aldolase [Chryseobacterium limigenitum]
MSKIYLEDIKIYAHHGVLPEENIIGTYYILNLELHTDLWKASESDDLKDTISYADINAIVHDEMNIKSKLLEHVAGRIISKIHEKFSQISYIKLKITKTAPPMQGEMKGASIELEKSFKPEN